MVICCDCKLISKINEFSIKSEIPIFIKHSLFKDYAFVLEGIEPFIESNSHKLLYKNWDPITLRGYKLTFYRELLTFQRRFLFQKRGH